jgi:uncharacterized protein YydD (DUF2326 family)
MFLKNLNISGIEGEIRDIEFKKGVNLIVDGSENPQESGNNVGKTTILRLIDFCLAGDGKNIYTDSEFKGEASIKRFLLENEVLITLILADSLDIQNARTLKIERNFLPRSEKILRINGKDFTKKEFERELSRQLFKYVEGKPTIRQLISKNIRDEKNRLNNILNVLHPTTKDVEYEALYQFWFGVQTEDGEAYRKATDEKTKQENYRLRLAKEFTITDFSVLPEIETRIKELEARKEALDLSEDYQEKLNEFDKIKIQLTQKAIQQSTVRLRIDLIEESKKSLENDRSKISADEIRDLYDEAKLLIPNLQKSFEESLTFHNQMIENKLHFITRDLPEFRKEEQQLTKTINKLEAEASEYQTLLKTDSTLSALEDINTELRALTGRHAALAEQKRIWDECLKELTQIKEKLNRHASKAETLNEQVDENLEVFNPHFRRISKKLYKDECAIKRKEFDDRGEPSTFLKFAISGISANPGTGEKKGQITAFDLAYIEFAEELDIPHLNFILHDQIENVDGRQIVTILEKLVPSINCQYIAPILKDKVPEEIDLDRYKIIELSQSDKLFQLES